MAMVHAGRLGSIIAVCIALAACQGGVTRATAARANTDSATVISTTDASDGTATGSADYRADGRLAAAELLDRVAALSREHGFTTTTVFTYPGDGALAIRAWRTPRQGPALWLLAGIHGEEPAGPNAIAASIAPIAALARAGVPMVVIPLCNPRGYANNWRYPNTPERDWRSGGGYSVGDSEYLLPDVATRTRPRAPAPPGPETAALTRYALELSTTYPPLLVLDLHEDELSMEGGYLYTQGRRPSPDPVAARIVDILQRAGIALRMSGQTRFGETIVAGVIDGDGKGQPIHDGSIDELLIAPEVFRDGRRQPGPGGANSIVVETPAFAGSRLEARVAAHAAVLAELAELWRLNGEALR